MMTIQKRVRGPVLRYFDGKSEAASAIQAWQLAISCQITPTLATRLICEYGYPIAVDAAKASTRGHSAEAIASALWNDDCPSGIREAIAAGPDPKLVELTAIKLEVFGWDDQDPLDFDWWVCDAEGLVLEGLAGYRATNLIGLVPGNPVNFELKDDSGNERTLKYNVVSIVKSTETELKWEP